MADDKLSFEMSIKRLEEIITKLESPDTPLEEATKLYEEGIKLSNNCNSMLENAHQKVLMITKDKDGNICEENFRREEE